MSKTFANRDGPRTANWTECSLIKAMITSSFNAFSPEQAEKIVKAIFPKVVVRVESSDWYQDGQPILTEDINSILVDILCGK